MKIGFVHSSTDVCSKFILFLQGKKLCDNIFVGKYLKRKNWGENSVKTFSFKKNGKILKFNIGEKNYGDIFSQFCVRNKIGGKCFLGKKLRVNLFWKHFGGEIFQGKINQPQWPSHAVLHLAYEFQQNWSVVFPETCFTCVANNLKLPP